MIWFVCKQCGKYLKRPESAAGSLVFCECGQANRVPWESVVPAREEPTLESDSSSEEPPSRRRLRREPEPLPRDSAYCFNHQEVSSEQTCDDCGERFCAACVVVLRGKTLCGPCKNYRIARMQQAPHTSGMAVTSLVIAIVGGPLAFCISTAGRIGSEGSSIMAIILGIAGLLLPAIALALGFLAMREIDNNPRVGGRGLAVTGMATAAIGVVWSVSMMLVLASKPFVE